MLGFQFYLTDVFLDGKFSWYGLDAVVYYSRPYQERNSRVGGIKNPLCSLFPTEVSCSIPTVGAAGEGQTLNGLCVLTQNIINEKIYLLLWFWFVFLAVWSVASLFGTVAILFFDKIRFLLIYKEVL